MSEKKTEVIKDEAEKEKIFKEAKKKAKSLSFEEKLEARIERGEMTRAKKFAIEKLNKRKGGSK